LFEKEERYLLTPSGNLTLFEVYRERNRVVICYGNNRVDLELDSALDLADAILLVSGDPENSYDQ